MASLVLPPVTRRRSLVTGTGSNYQDRRSLTDRPRQASPDVPPRTGSSGQKGRSSRNRHSSDHQEMDEDKLRAHRFWVAWGRQVAEDMLRTSMERDSTHVKEIQFTGRCGNPQRFRRISSGESVDTDLSLLTCSTGAGRPITGFPPRRVPASKTSGSPGKVQPGTPDTASSGAMDVHGKNAGATRVIVFRPDVVVTSEEWSMLRMCTKTRGIHGKKKAASIPDVEHDGWQRDGGAGKLCRRSQSVQLGMIRGESAANSQASEKRKVRAQLNRSTTMLRFRQQSSHASEVAFSRQVGRRIRATVFALECMTGYGDSTDVVVDVDGDVGLYTGADYARIARYPQNIRVAPQLSRGIQENIRARMGKRRIRPITVADVRSLDSACAELGRYQRNLMIFNWLQEVDAADFTALPEPTIVELETVPPRVRDYPPRSPTQFGGLSRVSTTTEASEDSRDIDIDFSNCQTAGSQEDGSQLEEKESLPSRR